MANVMKVFFLFLFMIVGAYLSGVRIHPEAFSASVASIPVVSSKKGVEILFANGQRATGQIVKEIPGGILFNMDGAEVSFTNDEIVSHAEVTLPSSGSVKHTGKQKTSFLTYDPGISIFAQIAGKDTEKKPAFQASSLWGAKPRAAASNTTGAKAPASSMMEIYQKSMSKESLDAWGNDAMAQMGQGRNPFVEARNAAQAKAAAGNTAKSEAKLKELEENGY